MADNMENATGACVTRTMIWKRRIHRVLQREHGSGEIGHFSDYFGQKSEKKIKLFTLWKIDEGFLGKIFKIINGLAVGSRRKKVHSSG